jgi:high-affinity Fe2+/Pb2+ permease
MLSAIQNNQLIRNYIIVLASVMMVSVGLADLHNQPSRLAQQDRLDNYGRFISAGLVAQAQKAQFR